MTAVSADRVQAIGAWTNLQGVRPAFAAGISSRSATSLEPTSRLSYDFTNSCNIYLIHNMINII
jgi:hypothetical protein